MKQKNEASLSLLTALPLIGNVLTTVGISWAALPDGEIQDGNAEFDRIFGHAPGHFKSVEQLIEEVYLHERQRTQLLDHWRTSSLRRATNGVTIIPETEIDVMGGDGELRSILHFCIMLHEQRLAVAYFRDITPIKRDHQQLRDAAFLDPLTGLANRRSLTERWQEEMHKCRSRRLAFLLIDLNDFKAINDTYGHDTGDEVLCAVAERLQSAVRASDLACRLGGDEFGVLLEAPRGFTQVETVCRRITAALADAIDVNSALLRINASIGGCLYPDQADDLRSVLQRADRAMYRVKKGKGGWGW